MESTNRIREIRKSKGMTGPEVAAILGISTQYLYDIERNKRGLSSEIVSRLSDIFQATTDYILGRTDTNLYSVENANNPDPHEESELAEIPIERLHEFKLVYRGHTLNEEEAKDVIELLEAALKRWKI